MLLPTFTELSSTAGGSGRQMARYHMGLGNSGYTQGSGEVFSAAFLQLCVCPSSEALWGPAPSVCLQLELDELQLFLFSFSPQLSPFPWMCQEGLDPSVPVHPEPPKQGVVGASSGCSHSEQQLFNKNEERPHDHTCHTLRV